MPRKLTPTQLDYLQWVKEGNSIHFCTEVSNQLGEMVYSTPPTFKTNHKAILNLLRDGYLSLKEEFKFGVRWAVLSISSNGSNLLDSHHE